MKEIAQSFPTTFRPTLGGARALLTAAGVCTMAAGLGLSPALVERYLLSGGGILLARDLACLSSVRGLFVALGGALLLLGAAWKRVFVPLSPGARMLFFTPIVVFGAVVASKILYFGSDPVWYRWLTREDSLFEWTTWVVYLGASAYALSTARGWFHRQQPLLGVLFAGLAAALFFVAMEEISWGQRLFDIATPESFAHNVQGELTVHNLPAMQRWLHLAYIVLGVSAAFAWLLAPLARRTRGLGWLAELMPPWTLAPWFLPVAIVYACYQLAAPLPGSDGQEFFGCFTWNDQELVEMLLAVGFLLFVAGARRRSAVHG